MEFINTLISECKVLAWTRLPSATGPVSSRIGTPWSTSWRRTVSRSFSCSSSTSSRLHSSSKDLSVSVPSIHLSTGFIYPFYFISLLPLLPPTDYSFMSEHLDLRHVMGVGIAITRGSAASLSFCYCLLLLTMSRNLLTKLKEHSLHQVRLFNNNFVGSNILECPFLFPVHPIGFPLGVPQDLRLHRPLLLHHAHHGPSRQLLPRGNPAGRAPPLSVQGA